MNKAVGAAVLVATFLGGAAVGQAGQTTPAASAPKVVTHTVTHTVQAPPVVKYRTKTVYRTPAPCKIALDDLRQAGVLMGKSASASLRFDYAATTSWAKKATAKITAATPPYQACMAG